MYIERSIIIPTALGAVKILPFYEAGTLTSLHIFYQCPELRTLAQMQADIADNRGEILAEVRAIMDVPEDLLDRMHYNVHPIALFGSTHLGAEPGELAGVSAVLLDVHTSGDGENERPPNGGLRVIS